MIRDQLADALRGRPGHARGRAVPDVIRLERPARREHGDWSCNVALATAKAAGRNPRELAGQLAELPQRRPPRPRRPRSRSPGPGFVNFRLADTWLHDVLAEVVDRGRRRLRPARHRGRPAGQRRVRQRQPHRPAPRRPRPGRGLRRLAGPAARALRLRRVAASTTSTTAARRWPTFAASLAARKAGAEPARGRLRRAVHHRLGRGDARRRRPARVGRGAGHRGPPRGARPRSTSTSTPGSASARWSSRAPWRPPWPTSAAHGVVVRGRRRHLAAQHRLRRRQGPRARPQSTASPPTCCPTSPTTATSSPGASTCSSTCGAPTTTATCRA